VREKFDRFPGHDPAPEESLKALHGEIALGNPFSDSSRKTEQSSMLPGPIESNHTAHARKELHSGEHPRVKSPVPDCFMGNKTNLAPETYK